MSKERRASIDVIARKSAPKDRVKRKDVSTIPIQGPVRPKRATRKSVKKTTAREGRPLKEKDAVHVVIRVKSEGGQSFAVHRRVIEINGAAVLGKIGQPLGAAFVKELNDQIARDLATYLLLTTREGWNGPYVTYRCTIKRIFDDLPDAKLALVPKYYSHAYKQIKTWFEISSLDKLSRDEMNRIVVLSSGRHILSVLKSSAVVFRVAFGH